MPLVMPLPLVMRLWWTTGWGHMHMHMCMCMHTTPPSPPFPTSPRPASPPRCIELRATQDLRGHIQRE